MYQIGCPNCSKSFQIPTQLLGQRVSCPHCKCVVTTPLAEKFKAISAKSSSVPSGDNDADDKLSRYTLIFVSIFIINLVLFLGTALIANLALGVFVVLIAILIEFAVWQRESIIALVRSLSSKDSRAIPAETDEIVDAEKVVQKTKQERVEQTETINRDKGPHSRSTIHKSSFDDDLVTVQESTRSYVDAEKVPIPPRSQVNSVGKKKVDFGNLPPYVQFFGVNDVLDLGFGRLHAPLVYATSQAQRGQFDASLIDNTLPISDSNRTPDRLPYWPSYYDATPTQRASYLKWLLNGKSDPNVELGYVFLYFYGLEYRVIVENSDHAVIVEELIRLLKVYGQNNSFKTYSTRLMWLSLSLFSLTDKLQHDLIERAINATERWNEELGEYFLATVYQSKCSITPSIAGVIASIDHRSTNSVIVRRHQEQFNQLFATKYERQFPTNFQLKASKRSQSIQYHPASPTLLYHKQLLNNLPDLPDVARMTSQFKPLVELWETCINELKTFNRLHNKSDGKMTSEVYESLPVELRTDDHPEYDRWIALWEKHADAEGYPVVPVSELAKLKGIPECSRLTKTQCHSIAQTATAIGIGFVPEIEIMGQNFDWDEPVCLFFDDPQSQRNPTAYKAAAILLRLGMSIAAADGNIEKVELKYIDEFLADSFDLGDADSSRLECLTYLLSKYPHADNKINKALCKHLTKLQRKMVGEFLVGIALADQVLDPGEIKALKKAYRSLELQQSDLDQLLNQSPRESEVNVPGSRDSATTLKLDLRTIDNIMSETRMVSRVLQDAMSEDLFEDIDDESAEVDENQVTPDHEATGLVATEQKATASTDGPNELPEWFSDLPSRYHSFLKKVLTKKSWLPNELDSIARENGQMLAGIVEAINEWSMEQFDDWLIEEGAEYQINTEILETI